MDQVPPNRKIAYYNPVLKHKPDHPDPNKVYRSRGTYGNRDKNPECETAAYTASLPELMAVAHVRPLVGGCMAVMTSVMVGKECDAAVVCSSVRLLLSVTVAAWAEIVASVVELMW